MSSQLILVTAGYDHSIKFWDVASGLPIHNIPFSDSHINKMAISTDRRYLAVAGHMVVKVYQLLATGAPDMTAGSDSSFEGHTGNITALGFQRDNKWFFTASEDGTLKIFDFKMSGFMRNFNNDGVMVNAAVLHPNQGEIIFGDQSGRVRIWDLTEQVAKELYIDAEETPIRSLAISRDATKLVAGNNLGTCFIWESKNGENFLPM
jgi:target of rapamycin complex subunit LST8